jgi:hypothetical protein
MFGLLRSDSVFRFGALGPGAEWLRNFLGSLSVFGTGFFLHLSYRHELPGL